MRNPGQPALHHRDAGHRRALRCCGDPPPSPGHRAAGPRHPPLHAATLTGLGLPGPVAAARGKAAAHLRTIAAGEAAAHGRSGGRGAAPGVQGEGNGARSRGRTGVVTLLPRRPRLLPGRAGPLRRRGGTGSARPRRPWQCRTEPPGRGGGGAGGYGGARAPAKARAAANGLREPWRLPRPSLMSAEHSEGKAGESRRRSWVHRGRGAGLKRRCPQWGVAEGGASAVL